jgi:hypothetical protein
MRSSIDLFFFSKDLCITHIMAGGAQIWPTAQRSLLKHNQLICMDQAPQTASKQGCMCMLPVLVFAELNLLTTLVTRPANQASTISTLTLPDIPPFQPTHSNLLALSACIHTASDR